METDSFFCHLFKQLPETVFELIGLPAERARWYRFDAVELKKAFRIDGLLQPTKAGLPLYFVEVQYHASAKFYANLFAKVFCFLEENDPTSDWAAVAIFSSRGMEPKQLEPYESLLHSRHVHRVYLNELAFPADPPPGLGILQLATAPEESLSSLVNKLVHRVERKLVVSEADQTVIELVEELLMRRFTEHNREEIRKMFQLHDIRKSKVWQEAHETGIEKGRLEGKSIAQQELVHRCLAKGMSVKEIAELIAIPVKTVRRFAKNTSN